MNISYLVFGDELKNHIQTNFSVMTFLSQKETTDRIIILTDKPQYYNYLKEYAQIIPISDKDLAQWKGERGYFWRVKIKAIELVISQYPQEDLLYLDSDTFLFGSLNGIKDKLNAGFGVMHLNEGLLCKLPTKSEKKMWSQFGGNTYAGVQITDKSCMWNAGVIGIPKEKTKQVVNHALNICDAILAHDNHICWLTEQFSFSTSMVHNTQLVAADDHIGHYWGNKDQWNTICGNVFTKLFFQNTSVEESIQYIKDTIDFTKIPVYVKTPSLKNKLIDKLNKIFPDKDHKYIR